MECNTRKCGFLWIQAKELKSKSNVSVIQTYYVFTCVCVCVCCMAAITRDEITSLTWCTVDSCERVTRASDSTLFALPSPFHRALQPVAQPGFGSRGEQTTFNNYQ